MGEFRYELDLTLANRLALGVDKPKNDSLGSAVCDERPPKRRWEGVMVTSWLCTSSIPGRTYLLTGMREVMAGFRVGESLPDW